MSDRPEYPQTQFKYSFFLLRRCGAAEDTGHFCLPANCLPANPAKLTWQSSTWECPQPQQLCKNVRNRLRTSVRQFILLGRPAKPTWQGLREDNLRGDNGHWTLPQLYLAGGVEKKKTIHYTHLNFEYDFPTDGALLLRTYICKMPYVCFFFRPKT